MAAVAQLDLFAAPAPRRPVAMSAAANQVAKTDTPTLASLLPRKPPIGWQRRLGAAGQLPLELLVSALWTGVVVEVLSLDSNRIYLHRDGVIQDHIPRDGRRYRAAFVTVAEARAIHRRLPLALLGSPGTVGCRLTAATPTTPAWAALADWLDGIEALAPETKND